MTLGRMAAPAAILLAIGAWVIAADENDPSAVRTVLVVAALLIGGWVVVKETNDVRLRAAGAVAVAIALPLAILTVLD